MPVDKAGDVVVRINEVGTGRVIRQLEEPGLRVRGRRLGRW